ncbi:MAG: DUF3857 domain-containing protein, partial [Sphingomonas sp.]
AWIVAPPPLSKAASNADSPPLERFDIQQRIENGQLWAYVDTATRANSPELLSQLATLAIPWAPDKGDLIVHELTIERGDERIDLLAKGPKFTVLRREEALERRELTGVLTATLAVEGLRVGDVLHLRMSTTSKDAALAGNVQSFNGLLTAPTPVGYAHLRYSWPRSTKVQWKALATGVTPLATTTGAYTELNITLPAPKQSEMPADSPVRFRAPPLVEFSTFTDWSHVSKVMAPLYVTDGAIAPGTALAAEVAAIMQSEPTAIGRAQRALSLVQDKIRYLAVGMDGGNYVPQTPTKTWEVRYGDCKAKTLLLLALLRAMNIDAEPVLAHIGLGDLVATRLPSVAAFNHVLVRATIDGDSLWLDGTRNGDQLADIHDTPALGYVLPVRAGGADVVRIVTRANAVPILDLTVVADESASTDVPSVFEARAVLHGPFASLMASAKGRFSAQQERDGVAKVFASLVGEAQYSDGAIVIDPKTGTVSLTATGAATTPWFTDDRKQKRNISRVLDGLKFTPDRGRLAWKSIPVATEAPGRLRYHWRVKLPDGGRGYVIEGVPDATTHLAGYDMMRTTRIVDGTLILEEGIAPTGEEIAPENIARERDIVATAKAQAPRVVAPDSATRRWNLDGKDPPGASQIKAAEAIFAKAIANEAADKESAAALDSRASFRADIGDYRGALADLTAAIGIEPKEDIYLRRAELAYTLGDLTAAEADAEAARALDPSSSEAINRLATYKAERGNLPAALALIDERIALGGDTKASFREEKATLLAEFGDPMDALGLLKDLIAEKPGSPSLLNSQCWTKATRSLLLDSALKDCTRAIELSSDTSSILHSRALVWYRLGKYDDALGDLDAALAGDPSLSDGYFLRSIVLQRLKRDKDAARDLAIARRIDPSTERTYKRYGITP